MMNVTFNCDYCTKEINVDYGDWTGMNRHLLKFKKNRTRVEWKNG